MISKMNKRKILIFCFILIAINVFSQNEELIMLGQNDTIVATRHKTSHLKSNSFVLPYTTLLSLPFYDDFARPGVFPYNGRWADQNVYINNTFCILPPSINVATFDALGSDGLLHKNAASSVFASDTLTSQPFNLKNYIVGAKSDNLYRKTIGDSFDKISDSMYYKKDTNYYSSIASVYFYTSTDTLYRITSTFVVKENNRDVTHHTYGAIDDSIYTKSANGYVYIEGSKNHQKTIQSYSSTDSLYLSFSVQPGGVGDMPESYDSLLLECYVPIDTNKILINEVANSWIELYNATDSIVNVAGYYIFNDTLKNITIQIDTSKTKPLMKSDFKIPNDGSIETRIPPLGLLVINASDIKAIKNFKSNVLMLMKDTISYKIIDSVYISDTASLDNGSFGCETEGGKFDGEKILSAISKNSLNKKWTQLWSVSSDSIAYNSFKSYSIPIDSSFLQKGFRFRFINYASLSSDKSHARNEDEWNLDEVSLYANKTAGYREPDLEFRKVDATFYDGYTSVPHEHVKDIDEESVQNYLTYYYHNTDTNYRKVNYYLNVKETGRKTQNITKSLFNSDIPPLSDTSEFKNFNQIVSLYDVFLQNADSNRYSDFDVTLYFSDNESPIHEDYRWNDTVHIHQSFYNYYAYDDGSSEAGWGIRGIENAQVAYKFTTYKKDTLDAILIYFNQTLNTSDPTFDICVWDDNKGKPGKLLAKQAGEPLDYAQGVNRFSLYQINPESILDTINNLVMDSNQTFYIGWLQPQDILLNVGVDLNQTVKKKLFFKTGINWEESLINNPIMLRPVFDKNTEIVKVSETSLNTFLLYPNPTKGVCTISDGTDLSDYLLSVQTLMGQEVIHENARQQIDLSYLPNGMYYVSLINSKGLRKTVKLLINH